MVASKDLVKIALSEWKNEVNFAYHTACQKARNANTKNTWQGNRSSFRKFTDLFVGDIAKNLVRVYLAGKGILAEDYDQVRIDNFEKSDLYDLRCMGKDIEVKSSLEKYDNSFACLINKRRIIIYRNRTQKDFCVQVFFNYDDREGKIFFTDMEQCDEQVFKNKYAIADEKDFVRKFVEHCSYGLLMGFVTQTDIADKLDSVFTYQNKHIVADKSRQYVDFFIKDARPMEEILTILK